ncbi:hypothetical protein [Taibaiella chishuiensis]|uniref:Alkylation response protein AidB-like acyl-CoA dehydrogenase n=1 Tax=Taibaiella chishuiensis TaxID=1434707 RepID=A0A2P8CWH2_9BACT|nr:hypothetical protein [Taibaiella chishuiensis]PSK89328.1 alkylation response protein AidB-like acyl-CoA dehydrogenase [Taibaiella chishuiensis]
MSLIQHPQTQLSEATVQQLRAAAPATEAQQRLPADTLTLLYENRWFHVLVPAALGGQELPLPEVVRLFEALAWADANVGWCVNLGAGANIFAGYLPGPAAKNIFAPAATCCAGSGAITGTAHKVPGGYQVSGRWKYASGSAHATHFTANCALLNEAGNPVLEENVPAFRSFIFPAKQVTILDTWQVIGLKATSSNDFEVTAIFVPDTQVFSLVKASPFAQGPLYRFPFEQMAVVNMACMLTGIALHFADLYHELAAHKKPIHSDKLLAENEKAQAIENKAATAFYTAREHMYHTLQLTWNEYEAEKTASASLLEALSRDARKAALEARNLINALYPLCGMSITNPASALNKVWRDAATAGQHYLLGPLY